MHIHDIAWLIALVSSFFLSAFNFAGAVIFLMLWNAAILIDVHGADEQVGIYIPIHKYKHIKPENIYTYTQRMNQSMRNFHLKCDPCLLPAATLLVGECIYMKHFCVLHVDVVWWDCIYSDPLNA